MSDPRYQCPNCGRDDGFWQGVMVSGWIGLDAALKEDGNRDIDWHHIEKELDFGCGECSWEGSRSELVRLGVDGAPLEDPIPGQLELDDAA